MVTSVMFIYFVTAWKMIMHNMTISKVCVIFYTHKLLFYISKWHLRKLR